MKQGRLSATSSPLPQGQFCRLSLRRAQEHKRAASAGVLLGNSRSLPLSSVLCCRWPLLLWTDLLRACAQLPRPCIERTRVTSGRQPAPCHISFCVAAASSGRRLSDRDGSDRQAAHAQSPNLGSSLIRGGAATPGMQTPALAGSRQVVQEMAVVSHNLSETTPIAQPTIAAPTQDLPAMRHACFDFPACVLSVSMRSLP